MGARIFNVVLVVSAISLAVAVVIESPVVRDALVPDWIRPPSEPANPAPRIEGSSLTPLDVGRQVSHRVDLTGTTTILYQWINLRGSNMNAMFQNDSLEQKMQFGLR